VSPIANRRVFLERANALVKKSQPDLHDLSSFCESLADVATDIIGAECRIIIKVNSAQLDKAIAIAEAAEKAGAR